MGIEDLFHTVEEETIEPIQTTVTGTIPEWIEGSMYRNGPAKFEFGGTKFNHWFDGSAMLHRFKITKGCVTYQNRFIETEVYKKNLQANRIVCGEFGTATFPDPCKTWFERLFSYFKLPELTDNTMVNVFPIGERLYTTTETNFLTQIDHDTLKSKGQMDLNKVVCVHGATAHPHQDTDGSGAIYNIGYIFSTTPKYVIIKITPPSREGDDNLCEEAEIVAEVPAQWRLHPGYMHSFAITPHYIVMIEQPWCINLFKVLTSHLRSTPFVDAMEFYSEYPCKFHIIDRRSGQKVNPDTEYVTDTFITYHNINAYEENDEIVVDTAVFPYPFYTSLTLEKLRAKGIEDYLNTLPGTKPTRFVLPVHLENAECGKNLVTVENSSATATMTMLKKRRGGITREVHINSDALGDVGFEFPTINYAKFNGQKYRYAYGVGTRYHPSNFITKLDVKNRETKTWAEDDKYCSEPIFVAAPDAKEEDDGVLLSVVLTTKADRSAYLLVLDAHSLKEIGRAEADVKIGPGFHGSFIHAK